MEPGHRLDSAKQLKRACDKQGIKGSAMKDKVNPVYLDKVKQLSADEAERILSRMGGKLPKRFIKEKLSQEEALALQLEIEDEQLQEWRDKVVKLREEDEKRDKKKKD